MSNNRGMKSERHAVSVAESGLPYSLVRKGKGRVSNLMDGSLKLESLPATGSSAQLVASVATADPGVSCWELEGPAEDKWYYVLEGEMEVLVNEISHFLTAGDSIYLKSSNSHIWRNPGKGTARALVVSSPLAGFSIPV